MAHRYVSALAALVALASTTTAVQAALTAAELRQKTPTDVIETIKTTGIADIEAGLSEMKPEELSAFLNMLSKTLDLDDAGYDDAARAKIRRIAFVYDKDGTLLDAILSKHPCNDVKGLANADCKSKIDGAAYGHFARMSAGDACWKTLRLAKDKPKEFSDGVREYYTRQARPDDGDLSQCSAPPEPSRCKIGWCSTFYSSGLAFAPLSALGVALPIGKPTFGFQAGQSSSVQATAGVMARGFILDGKLDLRVGVGITNAVTKEGDGAAGFAWTTQVGIYQVLGVGFLWITDPTNGHTGSSLVFSIDLVGVQDLIGQKTGS